MSHIFDGYFPVDPSKGDLAGRRNGVLVSPGRRCRSGILAVETAGARPHVCQSQRSGL